MTTITGIWKKICHWLRYDEELYLYRCALATMIDTAPPMHHKITPYFGTRDNIAELQALLPALPTWIIDRVQRGDVAVLGAAGGELIFYSTAVVGPQTHETSGYPLALTAQEVLLEDAATAPGWRGQGVAPGMLRPTAEALATLGITHAYFNINIHNTASCKAAEKGGAQRTGTITVRRRFGRGASTFTPLPAMKIDARLHNDNASTVTPHTEEAIAMLRR